MSAEPKAPPGEATHSELLKLLVEGGSIPPAKFKELVLEVDHLDVIAKVFLLEGTPHVFAQSPMKYMVFREQVADRFQVGYQDVCVVGSAKLGFSPSPQKFGKVFAEESDVDVVIISDELFDQGTLRLFEHLNRVGPSLHVFGHSEGRGAKTSTKEKAEKSSPVKADEWRALKEGVRNYVYQNFNPALLPDTDPLKIDIFQRIRSTTPLFLALEPTVFVSKIRCRIFRNWKAAEAYYSNTLRQLRKQLSGDAVEFVSEEDSEPIPPPVSQTLDAG